MCYNYIGFSLHQPRQLSICFGYNGQSYVLTEMQYFQEGRKVLGRQIRRRNGTEIRVELGSYYRRETKQDRVKFVDILLHSDAGSGFRECFGKYYDSIKFFRAGIIEAYCLKAWEVDIEKQMDCFIWQTSPLSHCDYGGGRRFSAVMEERNKTTVTIPKKDEQQMVEIDSVFISINVLRKMSHPVPYINDWSFYL
ncbi:hypothetical protein Ddc_04388 [Ditylenchus destructor]|nr:hypothetical protein Ddc_04388 [Ditylenchus destructor]